MAGPRDPCGSSAPRTGIPSTRPTPRPPTSTTSTAIWSRRGHAVTVVTPGNPSLPATESFDGVEVLRFPMELPVDLTYGRVAQSQVNLDGQARPCGRHGSLSRGSVSRDRERVPGPRGRRHACALGHPDRAGGGSGRPKAAAAERDHHARWRRVREPGAGVRFPDPMVRSAAASLDASPCGSAHGHHRRLPAARAPGGRARRIHPPRVQRHRPPPIQSRARGQAASTRGTARR